MIPTRKLSLFILAFFFLALVGCGSDGGDEPVSDSGGGGAGDGGGGGTPVGEADVADVEIEQLDGAWFGTFDDTTQVRTFQFTVDGSNISAVSLGGAPQNQLTGSITKATEIPRAFRFSINSNGSLIANGMMVLDPSASYMLYNQQPTTPGASFQFGVLQKGTTELPDYAQADIDGAWAGDTVTSTVDFTTFTQAASSAECAPTDPAPTPPTSACTATIGATTRAISSAALDHDMGRFLGTFTDDPPTDTQENVAWRAFLSPDKNFTAVWACNDFVGGFPDTCDFSARTRQ